MPQYRWGAWRARRRLPAWLGSSPETARAISPRPPSSRMAASCTAASGSSGAGMDKRFDVIIVGSGAGGGTLARHLAPSGKSVLILERGDWLKREQQNWDVEEVFVKNRYVPQETW